MVPVAQLVRASVCEAEDMDSISIGYPLLESLNENTAVLLGEVSGSNPDERRSTRRGGG